MNIVLLGYRGSGKSTVGRLLAAKLRQSFIDTDDLIIRSAGKTIKEIFEQHGEPHFRDLESAAVREALLKPDHVIAFGGGALKRPDNREFVIRSNHHRIYLRCDPESLYQRIHADPATAANRPSLTHLGGGIDEIRQLLAEREPIYRQVMTHELDVTRLTPEQAAQAIIELL